MLDEIVKAKLVGLSGEVSLEDPTELVIEVAEVGEECGPLTITFRGGCLTVIGAPAALTVTGPAIRPYCVLSDRG